MQTKRYIGWGLSVVLLAACVAAAPAAVTEEALPDSDAIMRAMADEMARSLELQVEDLEKPYFIQYSVDDSLSYVVDATYGALTTFDRSRSRRFYSQVRVGSEVLDNTNFSGDGGLRFGGRGGGGGGGGRASLPLDDDYLAIRQAMWAATDDDYKESVETLTKKRAYLKDKTIEDRPNDFSAAEPLVRSEPTAVVRFDADAWKANVCRISGYFKQHEEIQDSSVRLMVAGSNQYIVNSEGTRTRTGDTAAYLIVTAEVQAEDGRRITGGRQYVASTPDALTPVDEVLADLDKLVKELAVAMQAAPLDHYTGPVLFEKRAAAQMFQALLTEGLAGQVDPVGTQRRSFAGTENLEKKLGQRILPRSFQIYDDPTVETYDDTYLFGHYRIDEEGVLPRRVDLVKDGKLEDMCMSRVPTKKFSGSNGHARRASGSSQPAAAVGTLFIKDDDGLPEAELKAALIEAAKDEGLEYGVRVEAIRSASLGASQMDLLSFFMRMQMGSGSQVGDPVLAYKVYVSDGHEEAFSGCEFGPIEVTELKRIIAGGDTPAVYNYIGVGMGGASPPSTIIAPGVLFEELEVSKIEQEYDKLPILKSPLFR